MKRTILPAFAALLLAVSCNYLDRDPLATMAPENYFRNETDLQLFTNTFYNNILNKEPYNEQSDHYVNLNLSAVLRGGNARTVPNSGGGWTWTDLRKMNTLLEYASQCDDEAAVKQYTALTRFFRAWFYFEKIKRFGDVPWIDKQLSNTDTLALKAPRDSREVVMRHMLEDIDFAINNLPENVSMYRVNKWTALAFKSRFCLYEGTFRKYHNPSAHPDMYIVPLPEDAKSVNDYLQLAADAAKEVMDSKKYSLAPDYLHLFADANGNPSEYILAIRNDQSLAVFNNSTAFAVMPTQGCPGLTKKFVDSFLMSDGTRFTDITGWDTMGFVDQMSGRDPRLGFVCRTPGYVRIGTTDVAAPDLGASVTGYQLVKYVMDGSISGIDRISMAFNDMPVIRLAEVYLNYAEALAEKGSLTQEDLDASLNLLRDRVGMPHLNLETANANPDWYLSSAQYGYKNVSGANKGVILEIRRERGVELCEEGFRLADLVRWREGGCISQDLYGMYFPGLGTYDLTGDGVADICLWQGTDPKHKDMADLEVGVSTGVILSGGTSGYLNHHDGVAHVFNESRDYFYPIPTKERELNPNLKQNPGWNDGLSY